jgi:hypothetical protein
MHARWPGGGVSERSRARVSRVGLAAATTVLLAAGCSSPASPAAAKDRTAGSSPAAANVTPCGTTRTAANVPVHIQVERGTITCTTAMSVERDYAQAIMSGRAPGNGGGGPVKVNGWTCQGFNTPEVLKTGQASKCVQGGNEILAILPAPA